MSAPAKSIGQTLTVAVLAGGRSSEHEVSLSSGAAVRDGLNLHIEPTFEQHRRDRLGDLRLARCARRKSRIHGVDGNQVSKKIDG